jgi:hypothetical protein
MKTLPMAGRGGGIDFSENQKPQEIEKKHLTNTTEGIIVGRSG